MSEALNTFTATTDKDERSQKEKNLEQALHNLWSEEKMVFKAELSKKLYLQLAGLKTVADHYGLDVASSFHRQVLDHSVSIERKGRKEFIDLFRSLNDDPEEEAHEKSMMKRLMG